MQSRDPTLKATTCMYAITHLLNLCVFTSDPSLERVCLYLRTLFLSLNNDQTETDQNGTSRQSITGLVDVGVRQHVRHGVPRQVPQPSDVVIREGKRDAELGPGRDDPPLRTEGAHEVQGGATPPEEFGGAESGGPDAQGTPRDAVDDGGQGADGEGVDGNMGRHRPAGLLGALGEVEVLVLLGRLLGENGHVAPCDVISIWLASAGEGRCGDGGRRGIGMRPPVRRPATREAVFAAEESMVLFRCLCVSLRAVGSCLFWAMHVAKNLNK
jgi:hypothetical protein